MVSPRQKEHPPPAKASAKHFYNQKQRHIQKPVLPF